MTKPVLLVISSTYPRWVGDHEPGFVHELAKRLTDRFAVVVISPHAEGAATEESMDEVNVVRFRYAPTSLETLVNDGGIVGNLKRSPWKWLLVPFFLMGMLISIITAVLRFKPSVIHAHWLFPQGFVVEVARCFFRAAPPLVVTSHGADLFALKGAFLTRLKRWVIRRSSAVTVVSSAMLEELTRVAGDTAKASVRPMGVDLVHRFVPDEAVERSPDQLLFVGRLVEKKGVRHLIEALPAILEKRPAVRLRIAGYGPDEHDLKTRVAAMSLQQDVEFLGSVTQEQLPCLYREASLLVVPFIRADSGDQEGLGLVIAEALGCLCPVLAGNVPAVNDYGVDVVEASDPSKLSSAILAMLDGDPQVIRGRTEALRQRCIHHLDWAAVANGYGALLSASSGVRP